MTDRRGRISASPFVAEEIARQARRLPAGSRVQHAGGREGTVRMDNPSNVPGIHTGAPTAWCLMDMQGDDVRVCVAWDNEARMTWITWVPVGTLTRVAGSRTNRPSLANGKTR